MPSKQTVPGGTSSRSGRPNTHRTIELPQLAGEHDQRWSSWPVVHCGWPGCDGAAEAEADGIEEVDGMGDAVAVCDGWADADGTEEEEAATEGWAEPDGTAEDDAATDG